MKESRENIDKELLSRYLGTNGSSDDKVIIQQWLDNDSAENDLYEESLRYWEGINPDKNIPGYNGDHLLDQIHHKIKLEEGTFLIKTRSKIGFVRHLSRFAAILTVPLLIISILFYVQNRLSRKMVSWAEINAPYGVRTYFTLQDGTEGRLNGGSSLKFPVQFNGKTRQVKLIGEAYFDVVSNKRKPFIVSTENIDIKVTGTTFNVMAYANEPTTEVILKYGEVEVFRNKDEKSKSLGVLKPAESFTYNSMTDSCKIEFVNIGDKLSWLDDKLTFKYESFEEVIRKINRWYNVNIIIKDKSLESNIYYGTFQNESLDEVLKLLQYTAPIKYKEYERKRKPDGTFENRKIEIYSKQ